MMNLELSQLDQTTVLFFILSAMGLIRERKVLPIIIVLLGALLHGSIMAILIAALIVWHRVDQRANPWIQLKDVMGFFLIVVGTLSVEPVKEFSAFFGVAFLSLSFGGGLLGVLPALVLLRQYFPQPEQAEVAFVGAGIYWITAEILRFVKSPHEKKILPALEGLSSLAILYGFHNDIQKWMDDANLVIFGASIVVLIAAVFAWVHWRRDGFIKTKQVFRANMLSALTIGNRLVTDREPWRREAPESENGGIDAGIDRVFYVAIGTFLIVIVFWLMSRGGMNS